MNQFVLEHVALYLAKLNKRRARHEPASGGEDKPTRARGRSRLWQWLAARGVKRRQGERQPPFRPEAEPR